MDFGVKSLDEFWPEMRSSQVFQELLKDFAVTEEGFNEKAQDWYVVEDDELPEHIDGFTSGQMISINPDMDQFNKLLTFIHEITHALQFLTGKNKVQFKSDSGKLQDVKELKEYLNDPGERQAARSQVVYLCRDLGKQKDEAYEDMKLGWGIEPETKPEILSVTRDYFEELWGEVA
jgi:hypothetical protein